MRLAWAVVVLVVMCGCAAEEPDRPNASPAAPAAPEQATSSSAAGDAGGLVGTWRRRTTCEERARALGDADLGRYAAEHAAGEGWIPGVTSVEQLADPSHPCQGAVPLDHEHFFTASGEFGSRDAEGNQVDDGTFELRGPQTVVIHKEFGDVTFRVEVADDVLTLVPDIPDCADDGCFAAQWAVAVSYNGLPWQRVD
jgi:hypothetical protein